MNNCNPEVKRMKIVVDSLPENPQECLFSERNCEYGWICKFRKGRCKDTKKCTYLKEESKNA